MVHIGHRNNNWGFDYIIIHESGHEYLGNSISVNDHAELWIHESFTTYLETMYMEKTQGYEKAMKYIYSQKFRILNKVPIVGPLGVNFYFCKT